MPRGVSWSRASRTRGARPGILRVAADILARDVSSGRPPYYRGVPFFRLVSVILRITDQPVLLQYFRTVVGGPRNYRNVRMHGLGAVRGDNGPARGRVFELTQPARRITASSR